MAKIVVVIPTYNEADNLPLLAAEIWTLGIPNLALLVVDDNSPDGTGAVADELARHRPGEVYTLHRARKEGLGAAYVAGFQWALAHGAEVICQMDCDFSHAPEYLPDLLRELRTADVVVGSRYVAGGQIDDRWETMRYLLSYWANLIYLRLLLNLTVKDATAGFKCWRADTLRGINLEDVSHHGYSFQFEMAFLAEKLGYHVKEIPIYYEERRVGRSRLSLRAKAAAVVRPWQLLWRYRQLTPSMRRTLLRGKVGMKRKIEQTRP